MDPRCEYIIIMGLVIVIINCHIFLTARPGAWRGSRFRRGLLTARPGAWRGSRFRRGLFFFFFFFSFVGDQTKSFARPSLGRDFESRNL